MSIPLLIHWISTNIILVVDSAPKIENAIFDPLRASFESSDSYLSNEMVVPILRRDMPSEEIRGLYDGYLFDGNKCTQFNERILCGYDRNKGDKLDDYTMIDLGDGCRSRGDRIECGYENRPYNKHLRRPELEHDEHHEQHEDKNHDPLARQAPTRTGMITTTNSQYIYNKIRTDFLENKLLKSVFEKVLMKSDDIQSVVTPSTETLKPITITTEISYKNTSTPISDTQISKLSKTEATTSLLPKNITSTQASESSESNDISSEENAIKRIGKLAQDHKEVSDEKRRKLVTLPELVTKPRPDTISTIVQPIITNYDTTSNSADLRMKTDSAEKITSACMEKEDTVVCYDFKT